MMVEFTKSCEFTSCWDVNFFLGPFKRQKKTSTNSILMSENHGIFNIDDLSIIHDVNIINKN